MDYKRFPYKLETTKIYIKRKDKHGNELPDKVTMVSKTTLLPKELAGMYCGNDLYMYEVVYMTWYFSIS